MKDITIYGAGGFGRETALLIQQINATTPSWNILGFFDDGLPKGDSIDGLKIQGGIGEALEYTGAMVIAVADPVTREKMVTQLERTSIDFPTLVHPSAQLGSRDFNKLDRGCIITAGVVLTTHITLGKFCIINLTSTIGHDVSIGPYTTIMPGCSISGNVTIGEGCLFGTGSRTLQNISIGHHATVGAGAVVTKDIEAGKTVVGVPARPKSQILNLEP